MEQDLVTVMRHHFHILPARDAANANIKMLNYEYKTNRITLDLFLKLIGYNQDLIFEQKEANN